MNEYHRALMDKPSVPRMPWCPICGTTAMPTTEHHMIPRSQNPNWRKDPGPTIYPCGHGTAGCHGKFEDKKLHLRWNDTRRWWDVLETTQATKYEHALAMEGWRALP